MKKIIKIICLYAFLINAFSVEQDIFQFSVDSNCDLKCKQRLYEDITVLIEFNLSKNKIVNISEYKLLQDAVEIGHIAHGKEVKFIFGKRKHLIYRIYACIDENIFLIGYFDKKMPKFIIKLDNSTLLKKFNKKINYKFIRFNLTKGKNKQSKKHFLKSTLSHTYGEEEIDSKNNILNPYGEGQVNGRNTLI